MGSVQLWCLSRPQPRALRLQVGTAPAECFSIPEMHGGAYYLFVYESEAEVAALAPDLGRMGANVLASARSKQPETDDFVSRFFGPCCGIPEDPVRAVSQSVVRSQ